MSYENSEVIVIRRVDFSESSLVLTLFSREFGKIEGIAKGARRTKSPFESALDLLGLSSVVCLRKSSDSLDLITEAKLHRRFRVEQSGLPGLYAGYYIAELLCQTTERDDPAVRLFDLTNATLEQLTLLEKKNGVSAHLLLLQFEVKLLDELGYTPSFDNCVGCGQEVPPGAPSSLLTFGLIDGGVLCRQCKLGKTALMPIRRDTITQFDALRQFALNRIEESAAAAPSKQQMGALRAFLTKYYNHLLGKKLRMQDYFKTIIEG